MCSRLDAPTNGRISFSDGQNIGSVATYECFPGYVLDGDRTRTCQLDQTWTGDAPVCRREAKTLEKIHCWSFLFLFNLQPSLVLHCLWLLDPSSSQMGFSSAQWLPTGVTLAMN